MSTNRSGKGPDTGEDGSWANETLPLSLRKELLERELSKLGLRKAAAQGSPFTHDCTSAQQHGESGSSHPRADAAEGSEHAS